MTFWQFFSHQAYTNNNESDRNTRDSKFGKFGWFWYGYIESFVWPVCKIAFSFFFSLRKTWTRTRRWDAEFWILKDQSWFKIFFLQVGWWRWENLWNHTCNISIYTARALVKSEKVQVHLYIAPFQPNDSYNYTKIFKRSSIHQYRFDEKDFSHHRRKKKKRSSKYTFLALSSHQEMRLIYRLIGIFKILMIGFDAWTSVDKITVQRSTWRSPALKSVEGSVERRSLLSTPTPLICCFYSRSPSKRKKKKKERQQIKNKISHIFPYRMCDWHFTYLKEI